MKLPSPEIRKEIQREISHFKSLLRQANQLAPNLEQFRLMLDNPMLFIEDKIPLAAAELGLSFSKLVELYNLPYLKAKELSNQLRDSNYLEFVIEGKNGLGLDAEKLEAYIDANAVIKLNPIRAKIYKKAEKVSKELNALRDELAQDGIRVQLSNIIKSDFQGIWSPNKQVILTM